MVTWSEREGTFVSGVILAAGESRRFGQLEPKQLLAFEGETLVRRMGRQARASSLRQVVLVVGYRTDEVERAVAGLELEVVRNPDYASGQSSSVRAGLQAVDPRAAGALFLPCDQPFLDAAVIDRLVSAFCAKGGGRETIVVPRHGQRRGAPVLFGRAHFDELARITGDEGGRQLLRRSARVLEVELDSERPLLDVDTPEDLARLSVPSGPSRTPP